MKLHQKLFLLLVFLLPVQIGRHFWPQWSYILGLRVDYLSPTVYLTDILILVILILWGLEKFKIKNLKFLFFLVCIFVFFLLNCFLAQNQGVAFYKLIKIIEFSLLGVYIAKNHYSLSTIHYSLIGAVIYSSLIAIAQFINQSSLGGVFWWLGERTFNVATPGIAKTVINGELIMRPYGTFPHPNVLAGFTLVSLLLFGNWKLEIGNWRLIKWTAIILGTIAIAISFSRSVWLVGVIVGLIISLLALLRRGICLLLVAAIGAFFYLAPQFSTEEAVSQRLQLIKVAINMVREKPLVGVGLNNFIPQLPSYWQNLGFTYWLQPVHNIFLLAAAETGLIGLLIFLWFLFLTYRKLLITNYYLLIIALSAILALGFFDHYWLTLQQTQLLATIVFGLVWGKMET